jgi:hypothetical protein
MTTRPGHLFPSPGVIAGGAPKTFLVAGPEIVNAAVAAADCFKKARRDSVLICTSLKVVIQIFKIMS